MFKSLTVFRSILWIVLFLTGSVSEAMDPVFSQPMSNSLYLNPALAGATIQPSFSISYRNQWPKTETQYKTFFVQYHQYMKALRGSIGVYYMHDDQWKSFLVAQTAKLIYSYRLEVNNNLVIQPAVGLSLIHRSYDWDRLTFGDDFIDPRYGFKQTGVLKPENETQNIPDYSAGIIAYSKLIYGGCAVEHILEPNLLFDPEAEKTNDSKLPLKLTLHAGATIPLDSMLGIELSPTVIYWNQGDFHEWTAQVSCKISYAVFGLGTRFGGATFFSVGFQNHFMRIGYSYDNENSKTAGDNLPAHEFFLSFLIADRNHASQKIALKSVAF